MACPRAFSSPRASISQYQRFAGDGGPIVHCGTQSGKLGLPSLWSGMGRMGCSKASLPLPFIRHGKAVGALRTTHRRATSHVVRRPLRLIALGALSGAGWGPGTNPGHILRNAFELVWLGWRPTCIKYDLRRQTIELAVRPVLLCSGALAAAAGGDRCSGAVRITWAKYFRCSRSAYCHAVPGGPV